MIIGRSFLLVSWVWEAAAGMPTFRPDERDLTSVEPDRHRSLIGRQTPGRANPTNDLPDATNLTRRDPYLTYKSALHPIFGPSCVRVWDHVRGLLPLGIFSY